MAVSSRSLADVRLAAVIPVHGREPLLFKTVSRLKRQTLPLHAIVCVGDTETERKTVEDAGGVFVTHANKPLGAKWQRGVNDAKNMGATDILILGSSDWISDNWCETVIKYILNGGDLVGKRDIMFLDIKENNKKRLAYWSGYSAKDRLNEPIGAGRIISNEILTKLNWQIFKHYINHSLDLSTYRIISKAGGTITNIDSNEIQALSIGCYKWENKHQWNILIKLPEVTELDERCIDKILSVWFPDAINLFNE